MNPSHAKSPSRPHATADMMAGMAIVLSALLVAFVAFCVWLGVRIFNRRERWAKRTAMALLVVMPVAYPLSLGPVLWLTNENRPFGLMGELMDSFYAPLMRSLYYSPKTVSDSFNWYLDLWRRKPITSGRMLTYVAIPDIPPRSTATPSREYATVGKIQG